MCIRDRSYTYENNTNRLSAYTLELLLGSGTSKVKTSFTYGNKNGSQMCIRDRLEGLRGIEQLIYFSCDYQN